MEWKTLCYRVGSNSAGWDDITTEMEEFDRFVAAARKRIEPWFSAVFQADHLNVILGSGFTTAIGYLAGIRAAGMAQVTFGMSYDDRINAHADNGA